MSNNNEVLIIRFFSLVIISSNSQMTSSQNTKRKEALSSFYINASVRVFLSSTIFNVMITRSVDYRLHVI